MRAILLFAAAAGAAGLLPAAGANAYIQHNLVADQPGAADATDPNLVNAWDIAASPTGPFWLSANGTGLATVYSTSATATITVATLKVTIPPGKSSDEKEGPVSGQIFNPSAAFAVATGKNASFLFCTEDGTISGWNPTVNPNAAIVMVDNSSKGAVYKGCTIGGSSSAPQLYVANFNSGAVEVYDGNFAPVTLAPGAFHDAQIPAGFAPFNVANLNGNLYVAYAKQDSMKYDDVPGAGNGYVDVFDLNGVLKTRLIAGGALNSPWGMAIAPANFGAFSNLLLVGNFGDGRIHAYDPATGALQGTLQDPSGAPIAIPGLWGLRVGNGRSGGDANAVYFAAGPGPGHGLFGSLQAGPVPAASNPAVNGASFQNGISEYSWVTIFGANLSSTTRVWKASDIVNGALPTTLDKVSVTIDGKAAYIAYISPTQINALVPADPVLGPVQISVTNQGLTSDKFNAALSAASPAFFISKNNYIAGFGPDNKTILGPATLFPNASAPVKPGDEIVLFGTGFGPASAPIPDGKTISAPIPVTGVTITIGGAQAQVVFAGLVAPGVYQFNAIVPASAPDGDAAVTAAVGGGSTQAGALIAVQR